MKAVTDQPPPSSDQKSRATATRSRPSTPRKPTRAFQISLERAQHLRPPLAVPVGRLETSFGLAPALFRDRDQGPAVFKRLKRYGHGGLVASRCCHGCVAVRRRAVVCLPSEHDPALQFDLNDPDRERSWKIVEVPRDGCSRLKASLGSARREIARQLRRVDDGLEDLRDRFGDPRCYREGQVHRLPPCLPGPSRSAQLNSETTGEGRAVRNSLGHATGPSQSGAMNCQRISRQLSGRDTPKQSLKGLAFERRRGSAGYFFISPICGISRGAN